MTAPKNACACKTCVGYCERRPGFFTPDQIEPLATAMGLTTKELFDKHLAADPWLDGDDTFWVLMPVTTNWAPGMENPYDPRGRCTFLTADKKCAIHTLGKPAECAHGRHDDPYDPAEHEQFAQAWNTPEHQATIVDLLGYEPEEPEATIEGFASLMFGG